MLHDDHQHIHPPGLLGNEGPQLVQVDAGLVEVGVVGVDVEVPHTDLTEVSGMVLVEVDPENKEFFLFLKGEVLDSTCGDVGHQRFRDLRDASCAFRSYHDRERRVLSTCGSSSVRKPFLVSTSEK